MTPKTPEDMMAAVARSMRERTGRTLEEWVAAVHASDVDPLDQNAVRRWLRSEHGISQNTQWSIANAAAEAAGWKRPSAEAYTDAQYTGPKAALRPIFDRLRHIIEGLGEDVAMQGRASYTPFVRGRQFVAVAAATRTRVDVGLRFTDAPESALLSEGKAPGMGTHRLSLTRVEDVTGEVEALVRTAYEQN